MVAGQLGPTRGKVQWLLNDQEISGEEVYSILSIAAPYMELPEEMSFRELIRFHACFKPFPTYLEEKAIIALSGLQEHADIWIRNYSSGMKQRVKLLLAMIPGTPLLLLDEPCTNLDHEARSWYANLLQTYSKDKTIIVASNHNHEEYPGSFIQINL